MCPSLLQRIVETAVHFRDNSPECFYLCYGASVFKKLLMYLIMKHDMLVSVAVSYFYISVTVNVPDNKTCQSLMYLITKHVSLFLLFLFLCCNDC